VMADVGSSLAPGLFQGNIDAINAFASFINAHGGLACRKVVVRTWDSKLDPTESKNGQIDACQNAFAMVGTNALFNPDISTLNTCADKTGTATGLPDIAAVSADINEECGATVFNVQGLPQKCPAVQGSQAYTEAAGFARWAAQQDPGLHGLYLVAGDLPSTTRVEVPQYLALAQAGVTWDGTPKVSGADTQPAYTPRVQLAKAKGSTLVYDGSNDVAMVRMRKEANAQGLSSVKVWGCTTACYTKGFLAQGGSDVEGTYAWLGFLPFEEASYNAEDQNYVNAVGAAKVDSFGANGWQAAVAFEDAVNTVVKNDGPNGLTRANLMTALKGMHHFDAHGWIGPKDLQGGPSISPCFLVMQVQNGKFVRVYPAKPGTMDCNPANSVTVTVDANAVASSLK
ncbi:MAG TPA: ABC transporter substrate-binding protein, partial [Acidimicrobiales bacterium]|nr:ABC transporter substrate-binding protein [Acidimicrobiales bacterium]